MFKTQSTVCYLCLVSLVLISSCQQDPAITRSKPLNGYKPVAADVVPVNQVQFMGSHNSYRKHTNQKIYDFLLGMTSMLPASLDPTELDYHHIPLPQQMDDFGVRAFELDIYNDPQGGNFYNRVGNVFVNLPMASGIDELNEPGMKLLHIPDIDYETNYYTFKSALRSLRTWSLSHPYHLPLFVMIETKEDQLQGLVPLGNWTEAIPFDAAAMDAIDAEIEEVFGANSKMVMTPDMVRGNENTLREAVTERGWPSLLECRGKVFFVLSTGGSELQAYTQGRPNLEGRKMFVFADEDDSYAAFIKRDDPIDDFADIQQLVTKGFFVRTRADDGTDEARTGDYTKMNYAFSSGAQMVSTDYYQPDARFATDSGWTNYTVSMPGGGVARINPLNGPATIAARIEK